MKLTHFDARGSAHMVGVGEKPATHRVAVASGRIQMRPSTLKLVRSGTAKKGDVLGVARLAAIQAAKRTAELIPLAHPLPLTGGGVGCETKRRALPILARGECGGPAGVEREAPPAVTVGLLT